MLPPRRSRLTLHHCADCGGAQRTGLQLYAVGLDLARHPFLRLEFSGPVGNAAHLAINTLYLSSADPSERETHMRALQEAQEGAEEAASIAGPEEPAPLPLQHPQSANSEEEASIARDMEREAMAMAPEGGSDLRHVVQNLHALCTDMVGQLTRVAGTVDRVRVACVPPRASRRHG